VKGVRAYHPIPETLILLLRNLGGKGLSSNTQNSDSCVAGSWGARGWSILSRAVELGKFVVSASIPLHLMTRHRLINHFNPNSSNFIIRPHKYALIKMIGKYTPIKIIAFDV